MHQRDRADHALVGQVGVEGLDLTRCQHSFVDNGTTGERGEADGEPSLAGLALGLLPYTVDDAIKLYIGQVVAGTGSACGEEDLADPGQPGERRRAEAGRVGRDLPP